MESPGETLAKLLPTTNPSNEDETLLTQIQRIAKCAICEREGENTDNGRAMQILNTNSNTSVQQQISPIRLRGIIDIGECRECGKRSTNLDTAAINALTDDLLLQYTGERSDEDHWGPPELLKQHIIQTHDGGDLAYASKSFTQTDIIYENINGNVS